MNEEVTKCDSVKKNAFIAEYKASLGNVTKACDAVGISRMTFYRWKNEDEDFLRAVEDVNEESIDVAEEALMKQIKSGDTTAIIFYLKTKGKSRGFVEKQELSLNVPVQLFDFGTSE